MISGINYRIDNDLFIPGIISVLLIFFFFFFFFEIYYHITTDNKYFSVINIYFKKELIKHKFAHSNKISIIN